MTGNTAEISGLLVVGQKRFVVQPPAALGTVTQRAVVVAERDQRDAVFIEDFAVDNVAGP